MGNELASCACGQKEKKPVNDEKKPLVNPGKESKPGEAGQRRKDKNPKKRKKLFSKKRKKQRDHNDNQAGDITPVPSTNPDVKDIIRVDVEREIDSPVTILTPTGVSPKIARFPDDPVSATFEFPPTRTLYPTPNEAARKNVDKSPAKPRRNLTRTKHSEFGREPVSKSSSGPPVLKLTDDDIEVTVPPVIVHDSMDNTPEKTRQRLSTSGKEAELSDDAKSQISHALSVEPDWLRLDRTIREQYDIVYVAPDNSEPVLRHLEEIVVIIQREVEKIYVILNPNMIRLHECKLSVIHYSFLLLLRTYATHHKITHHIISHIIH